jgi:hypothetical protein
VSSRCVLLARGSALALAASVAWPWGAAVRADPAAVRADPAALPALPPLPSGPGFARLAVPGFQSAVVAWPASPDDSGPPLPVLIAAHGSYDQPEWGCEVFQQVAAGRGVVLCPRGRLRWDTPSEPRLLRYYFPSGGGWLEREIDAGVSALSRAGGGRVAPGPFLYIGFSQGAIFGAPIVIRQPARFPRVILVEGGHDAWTLDGARRFAGGGGQRVLFACGRTSCESSAGRAARSLSAAGVAVRVVTSPGQGHTYDGGVQAEIAAAFAWVVEGDARFTRR